MDCEMVGVGYRASGSMLARCSIVNSHGHVLYDTFVASQEKVVDYRTRWSGVRKRDLIGAPSFVEVQEKVAGFLKGRILIGHAIANDLKVLYLSHPRRDIRDTSKYKPLRKHSMGKTPSLKTLAKKELGISIQKAEHSSVEDAQATMAIYRIHKKTWEISLVNKKK